MEMQEDEIYETQEEVLIIEEPAVETLEVEMFEAFQSPTTADSFNHTLLNNREIGDAHPITAITGLREELDSIEALQTVYSDKKGSADYYEWADGNYGADNRTGCFVTLDANAHISICAGDDILGVVVDNAAFVGGQADIKRDVRYGLVATAGVVYVRRELDVAAGDYVTSNPYGVATKTDSNCGYRVAALKDINGVPHAIINLSISADQIDEVGAELKELDSRMDAAETNIVSAVNVANQAYQKASEMINISTDASNKANSALDTSNKVLESVGGLENAATQSQVVAAQAKAIAESTMTSAAAMCKEAVDNANKAVDDATKLRKEFDNLSINLDQDLGEAAKYLKDLADDIEPLVTWPEGATGDNIKGIGGFVKHADEDSVILGTIVGRKGNNGETLAGFIQEAEDTRATVRGIVNYEYTKDGKPVKGAAGLTAKVNDTASEVSAVANRTFTKKDGTVVTGLAGLDAQVTENESNISLVSNRVAGKYTVIDSWKAEGKNTSIIYYAEDTKFYWYYDSNVWKSTSDAYTAGLPAAIAGIQVVTDDHSSSINSLTSWQSTANTAMARIEQKADANGAYIQSTVANIDKYSVGPYSQAYGFTLEQAENILEEGMIYVPTEDKTTDNKKETYKYCNEPITEDSWNVSGKDLTKVYYVTSNKQYYYHKNNTWNNQSTEPTYTRSFTKGYLYKWGKVGGRGAWITVDKNYTETTEVTADPTSSVNTSGMAVYFSTTKIAMSSGNNYGYWYTNGTEITEGYEPFTLYKWMPHEQTNLDGSVVVDDDGEPILEDQWIPVATLAGNSQSRAVSQIRQDANSIEMSVTTLDGKYAGTKTWIDDNKSAIQATVKWKSDNAESISTFMQEAGDNFASASQVAQIIDKDGKINAASIVTAVNNSDSSVVINADHIRMEGLSSFATKDDVKEVKDNATYDTKVEYALSSSTTSFVKVTEWSTVAPAWQADAYMWQRTTITKGDGSVDYGDPTCIHGATGANGSSIKQVNTYLRTGISESEVKDLYGVAQHEENWWTQEDGKEPYDNSHLSIGDIAYITGVTSDTNLSYMIFGTVKELSNSSGKLGVRLITTHYIMGTKGEDGYTPVKGIDYFDGTPGTNGTSIEWKGTFASAPSSPSNGWAYYNSTAKASYIYQSGSWYQMSIDGINGQNGTNGSSIVWKGDLSAAPSSPKENWVYRDVDDGKVYIYNGAGWELMVLDGNDGADGADGQDGLSVFITYNDGESTPNIPTGNGTTGGWHTNATSSSIWMSQKVAEDANSGTWGEPIKIQPADGVGIDEVTNYYLATNLASGVTQSTSGWTSTIQSVSADKKYLWNYEKITYTDTDSTSTDPCIIGTYGDEGKGISDIIEYYQVSNSNTTAPTTWQETTPPKLTLTNKYLWNYEEIIYTQGDPHTTTPCVIGSFADQVKSEKKQFYLSTSDTSLAGGSWSNSPSGFTKGKYLWTRSVYTLTDNSTIEGTAVLDKTYTTISNWCSANNETLIDGANIATGTVTANKIHVTDSNGGTLFLADGMSDTHSVQIGGFTVGSTYIANGKTSYSDGTDGVYIGTDGIGLGKSKFYVTKQGYLRSYSGLIGGWTIGTDNLHSNGGRLYLYNNGQIVSSDINLTQTNTPHQKVTINNGGLKFNYITPSDDATTNIIENEFGTTSADIGFTVPDFTAAGLNPPRFFISSNCINLQVYTDNGKTGTGRLIGTWWTDNGEITCSWRGAKYDIEDLEDRYSILFDNLHPIRHKYNDGASGRYHTGFILDELKSAMDKANISTNELAAYCVSNEKTGEGGIRYEELVSLCVYEIQKLKARTAELEAKVTTLEEKLAELETQQND